MAKQGFRIGDVDLHVYEPDNVWEKYMDPKYREVAPKPVDGVESMVRFMVKGRPLAAYSDHPERMRANKARSAWQKGMERYAEARAAGFDAKSTLKAMDTEGVDVAVMYRTFGAHVIAFDDLEPDVAAAYCRAYNRWLKDYCDTDPKRLKVAAVIPQQDTAYGVREAEFAVKELGAVTLVMTPNPVMKRQLYHPDYDRVWAFAQDHNIPIGLHCIHAAYQDHITNRYLENLAMAHSASHPIEMMLAMGSLFYGGVLERFPKLKIAFLECNAGWAPWWLHRLDEEWEKFGQFERVKLSLKPSEYFKRQCVISCEPDEPFVPQVIETFGEDILVTSTDYPHDDAPFPHAMDLFLKQPISKEAKRKALWDNFSRFYNIN